ncbi:MULTISPECIES: recombination protein NinB [unclassified Acinetobacter]|uniref:recombination protein NinB n=1 Tax=unclassified Acinetobacter TaxID=196816 RepID=UPI0015D2A9C4|nr:MULTISPECIES: recombination protein NinB [unclassified Acinetobacter]
MQKAVFPIQSHADITKAINFMHTNYTQAINDGKPLVVRIDQKQEDRSKAQNRLLHMWFGQLAKHTGNEPEVIKYEMKKKFLARMCVRDSEAAAEAYEAVMGYRDVLRLLDGQEKITHTAKYNRVVKMFIQDHVKSSKLNKKQFTEFCEKVHAFANVTLGVYLTVPDDLMYLRE